MEETEEESDPFELTIERRPELVLTQTMFQTYREPNQYRSDDLWTRRPHSSNAESKGKSRFSECDRWRFAGRKDDFVKMVR